MAMTVLDRLEHQLCIALRKSLSGGSPQVPEAGLILWNAFQRLSAARSYNSAGPNPISFSDLEACCRLMRTPLDARHVQIILAMDASWLDSAYARQHVPQGVKTLPPVSKQPLNAALFDVMMQ